MEDHYAISLDQLKKLREVSNRLCSNDETFAEGSRLLLVITEINKKIDVQFYDDALLEAGYW